MKGLPIIFALLLTAAAAQAGPVNINSADAETLARELSGIGLSRAEAIVAYRESNGAFQSAEDLTQVEGVGPRILEANRDQIRLKDDPANP